MDWITDNLGIGPETQEKLLLSFLVVAGLLLLRWAILRGIRRRYDDPDVRYLAGKIRRADGEAYVAISLGLSYAQVDIVEMTEMDSGLVTDPGSLQGIRTREPAFGLDAVWIEEGQKQRAESLNFTAI